MISNFLQVIHSFPFILFFIAFTGYGIGRIRFRGVGLDLAGVLLVAVLYGALSSHCPTNFKEGHILTAYSGSIQETCSFLSSIGTAMLIASVGLSAGQKTDFLHMRKTVLLQILTGSIMVISGAIILIILLLADRTLSISCGLGLFAGAMTSTPSLAAAKEAAGIQASAAVAGYGVTYLPGVISIVLFVQIENRHNPQFINTIPRVPSVFRPLDLILPLGIILPGMLLGALPIPGTGITIGNSGGILLISLICGQFSIFRSVSSDALAFLRTLGLIFFLVGAGIPAGASFMEYIKPVYLLYGLMMSLIPAILGYLFTRIFLKYGLSDSLSLVSGGRTSTPAISALADSGKASFSCYAYAYCGALLTLLMVVKSLYLIFI